MTERGNGEGAGDGTNYTVVLAGAWIVDDVDDVDDAISVAVSEAGKKLNPDKDYVEVEIGYSNCPACGEQFDSALAFAGKALVGLFFEITIFNADSEEHASKIAKKEVGECLPDIRLEVAHVVEDED